MNVSCTVQGQPFVLNSPVMSAPGGFGNIIEYVDYVDLRKMGAVIPNSMMSLDGGPNGINKFLHTSNGYLSSFGPNNMSLATFIREVLPNIPKDSAPIIVDLKAKNIPEMGELAAMAAGEERIRAIEVNLNCPYFSNDPPYWKTPAKLNELMALVKKKAGNKSVIAKAPGGVFPMQEMAAVLEEAGTDMFVSFNCFDGTAVDIRTGVIQGGGYFGPGIKPFALLRCREAVGAFHIPVIGAGGITCADDVIEYIMAGAFAVQVGSANLTRPDFMNRLISDLEKRMKELGITSLDAIRGTAKSMCVDFFE